MPTSRERPSWQPVFAYPDLPHRRCHGPRGYIDDQHFKPWLRDEFSFRCIYCRCREVWFPDGDRYFGVEHMHPASLALGGLTDYDTLVYACCQCNAARGAALLPLDPCCDLGKHLEVCEDGSIRALTPAGEDLIRICRLDRPNLTAYRRLLIDTIALLTRKEQQSAHELLKRYFGYPANLPDLAALRPPQGNSRPEAVADCCYERRRRGTLPDVY